MNAYNNYIFVVPMTLGVYMLEILLILGILFLILTFFYKQAICEFRINQIEWSQKDNISDLFAEKVPFVLRSIPSATFWTHDDVAIRPCFKDIPIFQETNLVDWLSMSNSTSLCPWKYPQAEKIAVNSSIDIWANKWLNPLVINTFLKFWMFPKYHCWAGSVGLRRTFATWTCIFPVDGEILLTIMPETVQTSLPAHWVNCFPAQLTIKDTPFVADLKFLDIILRPGNCVFMPAHWFISWVPTEKSDRTPMVCTVSYHTPISYLAFHSSPFTTGV
jgi:hypothetical protein